MKRHFVYIAALLLATSFVACGNKTTEKNEDAAAEAVEIGRASCRERVSLCV